jgi:hypothetical protein
MSMSNDELMVDTWRSMLSAIAGSGTHGPRTKHACLEIAGCLLMLEYGGMNPEKEYNEFYRWKCGTALNGEPLPTWDDILPLLDEMRPEILSILTEQRGRLGSAEDG